jgi:hypothetical protein
MPDLQSFVPPVRSVLLQGRGDRGGFGQLPARLEYANGVEQWAHALQSDWMQCSSATLPKLAWYGLVVANLNFSEWEPLLRLAEGRPASQKWVSVIEGDALCYLEPNQTLRRLLNSSDLVLTINRRTHDYFASLTETKCSAIGIPYPVDFVRGLATPVEGRKPGILVCPRANAGPSMKVAESLGLPIHVYVKHLSRQLKNIPLMLKHGATDRNLYRNLYEQQNPDHVAKTEGTLPEFWKAEGEIKLWVNLDPRFTWARFVLDAACLGVPMITTVSTGHAERLFPKTMVDDVFCVQDAIEIGERLIGDPEFYREVSEHASKGMDAHRPEVCVKALFRELELQVTK